MNPLYETKATTAAKGEFVRLWDNDKAHFGVITRVYVRCFLVVTPQGDKKTFGKVPTIGLYGHHDAKKEQSLIVIQSADTKALAKLAFEGTSYA